MQHARRDYQKRIQDSAGLIPQDEPVFFLRGQDVTSAIVVEIWATLNEAMGAEPEIVSAARKQAQRMRDWSKKKHADMPPGVGI